MYDPLDALISMGHVQAQDAGDPLDVLNMTVEACAFECNAATATQLFFC